jgi:hypothetical protein
MSEPHSYGESLEAKFVIEVVVPFESTRLCIFGQAQDFKEADRIFVEAVKAYPRHQVRVNESGKLIMCSAPELPK